MRVAQEAPGPGSAVRDRLGLLLARAGVIASTQIRQALTLIGLGPRHGHVLMHLAATGPTSQQALIEALAVDPSSLVTVLNDLERDGLAERRRDPADRRRHIVEMSARGAAVLTEVDRAVAAVEQDLFVDLDEREMTRLAELLTRVRTVPHDCEGH